MNLFKTFLLMFSLFLLFMAMGKLIGGSSGMTFALIMAGIMNFIGYFFSDKIVLAMYRAKEASESEFPNLHRMLNNLCQASKLPKPKLYVVESASPNAFATGRDPKHASVAVTTGIIKLLSYDELEGVIGHELAHIKNRDILIATIAATIAAAITYIAHMAKWAAIFGGHRGGRGGHPLILLVIAIIAPLAAMIIQLAISRSREYLADETGARIVGSPNKLAGALEKLRLGVERKPWDVNPSTAHMFIVNPLSGGFILQLFSTHPPIEERVRRLRAML
ncbi:TPA: protease HtpX [bacterium]|nr:protease HtpX [bacterium]